MGIATSIRNFCLVRIERRVLALLLALASEAVVHKSIFFDWHRPVCGHPRGVGAAARLVVDIRGGHFDLGRVWSAEARERVGRVGTSGIAERFVTSIRLAACARCLTRIDAHL